MVRNGIHCSFWYRRRSPHQSKGIINWHHSVHNDPTTLCVYGLLKTETFIVGIYDWNTTSNAALMAYKWAISAYDPGVQASSKIWLYGEWGIGFEYSSTRRVGESPSYASLYSSIAHLTNCSFTEGPFLTLFRTAQVLPLLNIPGQSVQLSPYLQLKHHLQGYGKIGHVSPLATPAIIMQFQHSSIGLLRQTLDQNYCVEDIFYSTVDDKKLTALISPDISAAFDTISSGWRLISASKE